MWNPPPTEGPGLYVDETPRMGGPTTGNWITIGRAIGGVQMGVYTPTVTPLVNLSSANAVAAFSYIRIGAAVIVSGLLNVDPVAAGDCQFRLSLPLASVFTSIGDLAGVGASPTLGTTSVALVADTAAQGGLGGWDAPNANARNMSVIFMYRLLE
jgi:hypothetical protein